MQAVAKSAGLLGRRPVQRSIEPGHLARFKQLPRRPTCVRRMPLALSQAPHRLRRPSSVASRRPKRSNSRQMQRQPERARAPTASGALACAAWVRSRRGRGQPVLDGMIVDGKIDDDRQRPESDRYRPHRSIRVGLVVEDSTQPRSQESADLVSEEHQPEQSSDIAHPEDLREHASVRGTVPSHVAPTTSAKPYNEIVVSGNATNRTMASVRMT